MPLSASSRAKRSHKRHIQLAWRAAIGQRALRDIKAQMARHQRTRLLEHQIVEIVAILAPDLNGIAKALVVNSAVARALALDHRVCHQCGAVHQMQHLAGADARHG